MESYLALSGGLGGGFGLTSIQRDVVVLAAVKVSANFGLKGVKKGRPQLLSTYLASFRKMNKWMTNHRMFKKGFCFVLN